MRCRRRAGVLAVLLSAALLAVGVPPPAFAAPAEVTFTGHGFGHGRGLSQWGSFGYAVDLGWDHRAVLDHFYGGTAMGAVGNSDITVELLAHRGTSPSVTGPEIRVNGVAVGAGSVLVRREAAGQFAVDTAPGCGGPWTSWSGVLGSGLSITSTAPPTGAGVLKVCEAGLARGYRGALQVFEGPSALALVNRLPVEDYLLGVVPREVPASWGSAGAGRGMNALRAQAVAARSYALAGVWASYARTCDTTACQVYAGTNTQAPDGAITSLEHPLTNQAVAETAGQVRLRGGALVRTEFSSSSGGWTAGGEFPAVEDRGDATAANPHHDWTVTVDAEVLAQRLGTAPMIGIAVLRRNGLGADGGRVLQVAVDTTAGRQTFSGADFRARAQLRSDWFTAAYSGVSRAQATSFVRALYADLLGRTGGEAEVAGWATQVVNGADRSAVARQFVLSVERFYGLVDQVYVAALRRPPDAAGHRMWVDYLARGASLNDLNAGVYGSNESLATLGGGDVRIWVDGLYQGLLGRGAAGSERDYWAGVAAARGRSYVAFQVSASVEARERRLNGYYRTLLQRDADLIGVRTWVPLMVGRGDFDVQVAIAGSPEYWTRAPVRFP